MNLNDEVLRLIYGDDVNITELRKIKNNKEIWHDVTVFIANGDITKIKDIENMNFNIILTELQSRLKTKKLPKLKPTVNPVGFKNNITQ